MENSSLFIGKIIDNIKSVRREDWKFLVKSLLYIFVVCATYYYIYLKYQNHPAEKISEIIATVIVIPAVLAILDKFSSFLPIEKRIRDLGDDVKNQISNMERTMESLISSYNSSQELHYKTMNKQTKLLSGYKLYQDSKFIFGFNSVSGVNIMKEGDSTYIESQDLPLDIIRKSEYGDQIFYMTTYISHYKEYREVIKRAVKKGVKIKLLLMEPSEDAPIIQSRIHDLDDAEYMMGKTEKEKIKRFVEMLKSVVAPLLSLRDSIERDGSANGGSFEVEFYNRSLNFPLVCIEHSNGTIAAPRAYTGFYAGRRVEHMPFIEWQGGNFEIYEAFKSVFTRKWRACVAARKAKAAGGGIDSEPPPAP